MKEKDTAKQRLINVTIELICLGKKPSEITVADITEKAGVGNGMVNYHFQSKDNLMRTVVKGVMVCAKNRLPEKLKSYENLSAKERLILILKLATDFFAENPEICRIAILDNLAENDGPPHLLSDVEVFNNCLSELFAGKTHLIWIKNFIIAGFFNYIFLKADVIKKQTHFDFYDKLQRYDAVDNFISDLLNCSELGYKGSINHD
ncbi:MAG TPA: TetR/AcrR family transcriptional regulator [Ruminiclostridium sp.]